jgi:hypothetical protein
MPSFGRRNTHCSNCGDERGGPLGHETSECEYRSGMTVSELAATMPADKVSRYYDAQIDAYFASQDAGAATPYRPAGEA